MANRVIIPEVMPPERPLSAELEALQRVARLLDEAVAIPGTRQRIGLDAALGVVPWLGDVVGALMSAWILAGAVRHRVPKKKLGRMVLNVLIDLVVGAIPVAGDVFDALFPQNVSNVKMLIDYRDASRPPRTYREIALVVAGLVTLLMTVGIGAIAVIAWATWQAIALVVRALG
ncbi:MAG: DUF4112 domain-containing protein [Acidobacteria bacterium]|nr:DUF4112 domain-containing protein [Acidobacteriota bacterium]